MDSRYFIQWLSLAIPIVVNGSLSGQLKPKYHVLWIAVDDFNDWVVCFGGQHQAKTPNLDTLAAGASAEINFSIEKPGPYGHRVFTVDVAGRSIVLWRSFNISD